MDSPSATPFPAAAGVAPPDDGAPSAVSVVGSVPQYAQYSPSPNPPPALPYAAYPPPPVFPVPALPPSAQSAPTLPGPMGASTPTPPSGYGSVPPPLPPAAYSPFAPPFSPPAHDGHGGLAIAALICGVLAIFGSLVTVCDLPFAVMGIVFGILGRRSPRLGSVGTLGLVLALIGLALAVGFFLFGLILSANPAF